MLSASSVFEGSAACGKNVLRLLQPARLKFARHQRLVRPRLQESGRKLELRAIVFADRERVALIPIPHGPHGRRCRNFHLIRVDENGHARPGNARDARAQPREISTQVRRGPGLIVDVGALIVVERDRNDLLRDRPELAQDRLQPAARVVQVRCVAHPSGGRVVGVRVLQRGRRRIATFQPVAQRHAVFGTAQQPRGIAAVTPLVTDNGARPHDQGEPELAREPQHLAQIAPRIRAPVEIEIAVGELVPIPRHVEIERVDVQLVFKRIHRRAPRVARHTLVEERRPVDEEGPPMEREHGGPRALVDRASTERRAFRRLRDAPRRCGARQQQSG